MGCHNQSGAPPPQVPKAQPKLSQALKQSLHLSGTGEHHRIQSFLFASPHNPLRAPRPGPPRLVSLHPNRDPPSAPKLPEKTGHHRRLLHAHHQRDRTQHPPPAAVPKRRRQGTRRRSRRHQNPDSLGVAADSEDEIAVDELGVFAEGGEGEGGAGGGQRRFGERGGGLEEGLDSGSGGEGDGGEGVEGVRGEEGDDGGGGGLDDKRGAPEGCIEVESEEVGESCGVVGWRCECYGGVMEPRNAGAQRHFSLLDFAGILFCEICIR
ncbi:hypothetical protein CR513_48719, partial [Mucuna pruriens]